MVGPSLMQNIIPIASVHTIATVAELMTFAGPGEGIALAPFFGITSGNHF